MKNFFIIFAFIFTISYGGIARAEKPDISRYERRTDFTIQGITTPTVIQMTSDEIIDGHTILVDEKGVSMRHQSHKPHQGFDSLRDHSRALESVEASSQFEGKPRNLSDIHSPGQFAFSPLEDIHTATFRFNKAVDFPGIYINLASSTLPPKFVSLQVTLADTGKSVTLLDKVPFKTHYYFPNRKVSSVHFTFETGHLLRINKIEFPTKEQISRKSKIIFLAQEGASYSLYSDPHFGYDYSRPSANLRFNVDEFTSNSPLPPSIPNPDFDDDYDNDGLTDSEDLCPRIYGINRDVDHNGRGDSCEDPDLDGLPGFEGRSYFDNCRFHYNPDQTDRDGDGIGDACDEKDDRLIKIEENLWGIILLIIVPLALLVMRKLKKSQK